MSQAQGKLRLAVLLSGGGTNLQAMLDRSASGALNGEVVAVVSDRPDAYGLVRAQNAGVPTHVMEYGRYAIRDAVELTDLASRAGSGGLPVDLEELDRSQKIIKNPNRTKRFVRLAGLVRAEHDEWRADSADGSVIEKGNRVRVLRITGTRLIVKQINSADAQ